MDYIGSKTKLNKWIFDKLSKYISKDKWNNLWFMDGCAGSCSTSKYALQQGFKVISNDLFAFSSTIIKGFSNFNTICDIDKNIFEEINQIDIEINNHIQHINSINGEKGFFFYNYSKSSGRCFFTDANAMRIDATRQHIDTITNKKIKEYILYISLEGLSAVINTTGIQSAFLKKIQDKAKNKFQVKIQFSYKGKVKTYNTDLLRLVSKHKLTYDILYIDPPYNNRQYGPNYHLYETFIRHDNPSLITNVAGLRNWHIESKSNFCSIKTCANTFREIVKKSSAKLIVISYSSDGLLSEKELLELLKEFGEVHLVYKNQNRYKADVSDTSDKRIKRTYNESELKEFLFILEKIEI